MGQTKDSINILGNGEYHRALTIKVATLATSGPHVSEMISKVNARVPLSMPLLTKATSGRFE